MIKPADRVSFVKEYYFSKKLEEVRKLRASGKDIINLGIGSPDLVPSPETIDATIEALRKPGLHGYAPYKCSPELRQGIADWYGDTFAVKLNPATEILPLLGSKEGIMYLSQAYLNPGDEVLVPNPGYPTYTSASNLVGAKIRYYDLTRKTNWLPDLKVLQSQDLSRVKLIWVNYPHMPTGKSATEKLFEDLVEFAKKNQILICNDNPYSLVLNPKPLSILSLDPKREVALEMNSLSKAFNMAGWRVGMLLGPEVFINSVLQVKSNVDTGMFTPIQIGAISAFKNSKTWHDERNRIYADRKTYALELMKALGFEADPDQVGMFLWGEAPETVTNVEAVVDKLLYEADIFVTPGMIFGSNGNRYLRISLCAEAALIKEALVRVKSKFPKGLFS